MENKKEYFFKLSDGIKDISDVKKYIINLSKDITIIDKYIKDQNEKFPEDI